MDGLSVAASVAGLLQVGVKVIGFLSDVADAPTVVRSVLAEVQSMEIIFRQLERFVYHFGDYDQHRVSRIDIDGFVTILTGCVCTFSEIDLLLDTCNVGENDTTRLNLWGRARWVAKEPDLKRMLGSLQSYKSSLTLFFSIITTEEANQQIERMDEANRKMETFHALIETMLRDPDLAQRMASFASGSVAQRTSSILTKSTRRSLVTSLHSGAHLPTGHAADTSPAVASSSSASIFSTSSQGSRRNFLLAFERTLVKTRVCKNATRPMSIDSFNTMDSGRSRWSQLSGLSLEKISNISFICLPVYAVELSNGQVYQQVLGKTADGRIGGGMLSIARLQYLREGGFNFANNMRLRLIPEALRLSRLHAAAQKGDTATIQALLDRYTDIDGLDGDDRTALHHAAMGGHETAVRLLLDRGADMEAKDSLCQTPLHQAVHGGHDTTARLLVDRGVNIDARDMKGQTALHRAADFGREDSVPLLLDRDADVNYRDLDRRTPLHCAAREGYEITVRLLPDRGAHMNAYDIWKRTPLDDAKKEGHQAIVELMIARRVTNVLPQGV